METEDLVGRYIKVLKPNLGGRTSNYKVGDYLKIKANPASWQVCHDVEYAGVLNITGGTNRIEKGEIELMPEGFIPPEEGLTPFNLEVGEIYFMESDSDTRWYILNKSEKGSRVHTEFGILANHGYNSEKSYTVNAPRFYLNNYSEHAYSNCINVRFRKATDNEKRWFNHCKSLNKFVPFDKVIKVEEIMKPTLKYPKLSEFPSSGVCWQPTKELLEYLQSRSKNQNNSFNWSAYKGVAWTTSSHYGVTYSSSKTDYHISQLHPFLKETPMKKQVTYIPKTGFKPEDLEIGEYYYCRWDSRSAIIKNEGIRDEHRIAGPRISLVDEVLSHGLYINERDLRIAHPDERAWLDACIARNQFVPAHEFLTRPAMPEECYSPFSVRNDFRLPDKWCIHNPGNYGMIDNFMHQHGHKWHSYLKSWTTVGSNGYFHYPPCNQFCHSEAKPEEGYTIITPDQFRKHVLTNTNKQLNFKQNECNTIKVQGPNLSIRDTGEIRATGIRCSKVKIKIGSGYLPN